MDYSAKPTVFVFGKKKKDAPPEPTLSAKRMKECIEKSQKYVRKNK